MSRRRIVRRALVLLALVAAPILLLAVAIGSERGAQWLLATAMRAEPRLHVAHRHGTLLALELDAIAWQDAGMRVELQGVQWRIDSGCLRLARLCVRQLSIDRVRIEPGNAPTRHETEPFVLPPLLRMLDLDLDRADIAAMAVRGSERTVALHVAARKRGDQLEIRQLQATLPPFTASATARVTLREPLPLSIDATLRWRDAAPVTLHASGDLATMRLHADSAGAYAFTATAELALRAHPLRATARFSRAEPFVVAGLGTLRELALELDANPSRIDAVASAALQTQPFGDTRLSARGHWTPGQPLQADIGVDGAAGRIAAQASLDPAAAQAWTLEADLHDVCATAWQPSLNCRFSGHASAHGALVPRTASVATTLAGLVNDRPATLRLDAAATTPARWEIRELSLRTATTALTVHGRIDEQLALDASLDLPRLGEILNGARGSAAGTLALAGTRDAPQLHATLDAHKLRIDTLVAASLRLSADWQGADAAGNRLQLALADAAVGTTAIAGLEATLTGNRASQRLGIDARTALGALALDCSGARQSADWGGRCTTLRIDAGTTAGTWQADRNLALVWNARERMLRIAPFCMHASDADLCSEDTLRLGREAWSGVRLRGTDLPARWLAQWLPPSIEPLGTFSVALQAARPSGRQPAIDATLDASRLELMLETAGETLPIPLTGLNATLAMQNGVSRLGVNTAIGAGGRGEATIEMHRDTGALGGRIAVHAVDLEPLLRQLPGVVDAAGVLDASVDLAGTLAEPRISGEMDLAHGKLSHERLPRAIDDYRIGVTFEGPRARIDGRFHSPAGTGLLRGSAQWEGEDWSADLRASAEQLTLEPQPGSVITVVPDIRILLGADAAAISGDIAIASADIRMDRLPDSATSVSPDTVLLDATPSDAVFDYALDLRLTLGEHLRLRSFGADVRLGGAVRLDKPRDGALAAHGEVRVLDGAYSAYGQQLKIASGNFLFDGPLSHPQLRITAVRPTEDKGVEVGLHVSGDARDPQVRIFSRPTMDDHRAMHYLLTGRAPPSDGSGDVAVATALMQLGMAGSGLDAGKLFRGLGIRDFSVSTENAQRGELRGTEVHLSGYLTPKLYVRYGISTFDKINTFRLRYRLRESLYLEAVSGLQNALDLLYIFER